MIFTLDQPSLMIPDDSFAVPLKESRHGNHMNSQSSFERAPQSMEKRPLAALMCGLPGPAQPDRRGPGCAERPNPGIFPTQGRTYNYSHLEIATDIAVCQNEAAESDTK